MIQDNLKLFFGVKNLRIVDLPLTEFRPITILVGRNHSGKSTLLRKFPLIQQSIRNQNNGPISWHGDLVDYGNFDIAVKRGCEDEGIMFQFGLENYTYLHNPMLLETNSAKNNDDFYLNLSGLAVVNVLVKRDEDRTIRWESNIEIPDQKLNLMIKSGSESALEKVTLNGMKLPQEFEDISFWFHDNHILSKIYLVKEYVKEYSIVRKSGFRDLFYQPILKILESQTNKTVEEVQFLHEIPKILVNPILNTETIKNLKNQTKSSLMKEVYQNLIENQTGEIKQLELICGIYNSLTAYNQVCQYFSKYVNGMLYYKPTRTVDKRRFNISDSNQVFILPDGSNLSGFFESLEETDLLKFSKWMKKYFGYGISIEKKSGQTSIFVEQDGIVTNLVDSGFGISEFLPYLTQIWWETVNLRRSPRVTAASFHASDEDWVRPINMKKLIAIEQPELHLHPALQARLVDVLVDTFQVAKQDSNATKGDSFIKPMYLIETHSESFLNRLGELISKQIFNHSDIQILFFSKEMQESGVSVKVTEAYYDETGHLRNWPFGFFRYSFGYDSSCSA